MTDRELLEQRAAVRRADYPDPERWCTACGLISASLGIARRRARWVVTWHDGNQGFACDECSIDPTVMGRAALAAFFDRVRGG